MYYLPITLWWLYAADLQKIHAILTDLEDRSRRYNTMFRGVPEFISSSELHNFLQQLLCVLVPEAQEFKLIIYRGQRLPKSEYLLDSVPRDVLARTHYYYYYHNKN